MSELALVLLTIASAIAATLSATAAKVLNDYPRHEFEDYCERRKRPWLAKRIVEDYRQFCLGAEVMEMFAISIMLYAGAIWLLGAPTEQVWSFSNSIFWTAVFSGTGVLLLSSSWIPWAIVRYLSSPFLFYTWRLWWLLAIFFQPVLIGMELIGAMLKRLSGQGNEPDDEEEDVEDEILSMVAAGQTGGFLHSEARDMIEGVIELDELVVETIMTPRSRLQLIDVNADWPEILEICRKSQHSRIPVYQDLLDNIVGVMHTRDALLEALKPSSERRSIRRWMRKALRTPDTRYVNEMLKVFLQPGNNMHLAVVFNEHQTMVGVITIEDILEEIVGDITDETDREIEPRIRLVSENVIELPARYRVDELNDETSFEIPEDDEYDTVAGWILCRLGEVPKLKQEFMVDGIHCTVLRATPRKIEYVRLQLVGDGSVPTPTNPIAEPVS
ncbi:MAG: HlyC/CorC family transporter [Planctomycetaceae bacterium]|jgi:putative hemolysin|nr:HlyC/CorC family transporter [Planctomycetaceae bacterium]